MKIKTGQKALPLVTLVAIWSVSALNALPGLAVSPILGKMSVLFPHSSELSIEMLSTLPSLLIIPFILLSGKLTVKIGILPMLRIGLIIFALSGVLYLLSQKMWQLLAVSVLLGAGSGLIVPLSTGLISRFFIGKYRTKQFGLSSAITNLTLVIVTAVAGFLADINWHLPFVVYLLPLVSLFLTMPLRKALTAGDNEPIPALPQQTRHRIEYGRSGIDVRRLVPLMLFYGAVTYIAMVVILNIPFLAEARGVDSADSGLMISLLFLAIMAPGFFLPALVRIFGNYTKLACLLLMTAGMIAITLSSSLALSYVAAVCVGFGYGVIQPMIYDQTTTVARPDKTTLALAWVMAMNYVAIVLCPFIIDGLQAIFRTHTVLSPFYFNIMAIALCIVWAWVKRDTHLFEK